MAKFMLLFPNLLVSPQAKGVFLSLSFKEAVEQAIADKASTFTAVNEAGEEETYQLQTKNTQYVVRSQKATTVNDTYSGPSKKHWLGTDGNGIGHADQTDVWRTYFPDDRFRCLSLLKVLLVF